MQVASALEKLLSAPAVLIPMGQASDACHLANERLRCQNLFHGKNVIKSFIQELASYLPASVSTVSDGHAGLWSRACYLSER